MKNRAGLTFNELCEVRCLVEKECSMTASFNCGDFEKVFLSVVNNTLLILNGSERKLKNEKKEKVAKTKPVITPSSFEEICKTILSI